ncbi:MAG: hypothetical protein HC873_07200 [Leptolyngbyaceae cyanobacterium SL_1_1]|nr:hypothetical protein [Leptolyngbyaceae cyanobacterium SL_1_1]
MVGGGRLTAEGAGGDATAADSEDSGSTSERTVSWIGSALFWSVFSTVAAGWAIWRCTSAVLGAVSVTEAVSDAVSGCGGIEVGAVETAVVSSLCRRMLTGSSAEG